MLRLSLFLEQFLVALWVGGLWVTGYGIVPTLFAKLTDRQLAGQIAGWIFSFVGEFGIAMGVLLIALRAWTRRGRIFRSPVFWCAFSMLLLASLATFWIQPLMAELKNAAQPLPIMESSLRERFSLWHGISSSLYLLQSLLGIGLIIASRRSDGGAC